MKLYPHPYYIRDLSENTQRSDMFIGNQTKMRSAVYLRPYRLEVASGEGQNGYSQRQGRTWYTNYYKALVKLNLSYLFRYDPNFSQFIGDNNLFTEAEARNIDGENTSLLDFIKTIAEYSIRYPSFYVAVDAPVNNQITRQGEVAAGIRPFGQVWDPIAVPNWTYEELDYGQSGKLKGVIREYERVAPRATIYDMPKLQRIRDIYEMTPRGFIRSSWVRDTGQIETVTRDQATNQWIVNGGGFDYTKVGPSTMANGIEQFPIIRSESEPWLDDAMHELLRYHNLKSGHENILYYQCYTRVAIAGRPQNPTDNLPAAENTVMWLEKDSELMTIPAESADGMRQACEDSRNAAYRLALNQLRQLNASSKEAPSAESQHADKEDGYIQVKSKMREIEDTVNQFFGLWAMFKKTEPPKDKFAFSDKISAQDLVEFLEFYTASADAQRRLPTFERVMLKQLVSFAKTSEVDQKAIDKEIEDLEQEPATTPPAAPGTEGEPNPDAPPATPGDPSQLNKDKFTAGMAE